MPTTKETFPIGSEVSEYSATEIRHPLDIESEEYQRDSAAQKALIRARTNPALISADTMSRKSYKGQSFLLGPNLLPRSGKMLLTAENATGKSALALYMAMCFASGTPLFNMTRARKDADYGKPVYPVYGESFVTYIDYEIPEALRWEERLEPLVKQFGAECLKRITFPRKPSDYRLENGRFETEGSFERLFALVTGAKPDLIVIDPFSSTHSLDESSPMIKQALNNIDRLIDHSGTAVLLIHHASTKLMRSITTGDVIEKNAKEKARGHSCITDWADVVLHVEEVKQKHNPNLKTLTLDFAKTRYSRKPVVRSIQADLDTMAFTAIPRTDCED